MQKNTKKQHHIQLENKNPEGEKYEKEMWWTQTLIFVPISVNAALEHYEQNLNTEETDLEHTITFHLNLNDHFSLKTIAKSLKKINFHSRLSLF